MRLLGIDLRVYRPEPSTSLFGYDGVLPVFLAEHSEEHTRIAPDALSDQCSDVDGPFSKDRVLPMFYVMAVVAKDAEIASIDVRVVSISMMDDQHSVVVVLAAFTGQRTVTPDSLGETDHDVLLLRVHRHMGDARTLPRAELLILAEEPDPSLYDLSTEETRVPFNARDGAVLKPRSCRELRRTVRSAARLARPRNARSLDRARLRAPTLTYATAPVVPHELGSAEITGVHGCLSGEVTLCRF